MSKRKPEVDYDGEPGWVDLLFPNVVHLGAAIELLYPLPEVKTAEPLLRALAYSDTEPHWGDVLDDLRPVDDAAPAERVEALAATLPDAPKGSRCSVTRRLTCRRRPTNSRLSALIGAAASGLRLAGEQAVGRCSASSIQASPAWPSG